MVRKLTRRELRQRKASIKFAKTFIPLSLLLWLFKNLPYVLLTTGQYLDLYLGISDYTWSINQDDWCSGFREGSKGDGKVVVVTGANSGIGYPTAKNLALLGATKVVLGCRNKDKCSYAKAMIDAEVESLCFSSPSSPPFSSNVYDPSKSLDLSSLESVKSWVEEVGGVVPYVSHVALNAGVMSVPLEPRNEETGVEPQLHTNHVAHHYLTSLLLPSILSTPLHVIFIILVSVVSCNGYLPSLSFSSSPPSSIPHINGKLREPVIPTRTLLKYRQGGDVETTGDKPWIVSNLWAMIGYNVGGESDRKGVKSDKHNGEDERALQDHLKWVEKRYKVLHSDESESDLQAASVSRTADALYVLGLAEESVSSNNLSSNLLEKMGGKEEGGIVDLGGTVGAAGGGGKEGEVQEALCPFPHLSIVTIRLRALLRNVLDPHCSDHTITTVSMEGHHEEKLLKDTEGRGEMGWFGG
eukprot:CAMPEP_0118654570 /NCGR_PEP_ID=MMETSP0785-20121206/12464_1 /TAXON_ID=91992 /ORGANISM="Bolidomonas pacifica, Strain CCMP 1866" /LENGTH=468 /DNA_ID=CAMNT_0006547247 /DNA_START=173 /DNA_END=1578 /DNA_ORIENTATION=-